MDHIDNFYKRIEYLKSQKVVLDKEIELLMNKDVETMDIGEFLKICKYFEIIPAAVLAVSPSHDQKMMQYILEFHLKSLPEQKTLHSDEKPPVCI